MFKKNNKKRIIYIISFSLLVLLFIVLLFFTRDSKRIVDIKEFIKTDTKLLYITKDDSSSYAMKILDKYSIDYLKINSNELTIFERKKLENIIKASDLNNKLVIYKNGVIEDNFVGNKNEEDLNKFLQQNDIIPDILVDNVEQIMIESEKILDSEYSMVYIPYENIEQINHQDTIFEDIAKEYAIEYKKIDAYLLSNHQQQKINTLLGLSLVEDQILILIKDNKMVANIRGVHSKNTYVETLYDVNFISELENKINEINYDEFEDELENKEKSVILIGSNYSKDSIEILNLLNEMVYNYNIKVNYINIESQDSQLCKKVKEKLESIGYTSGFSIPLVLIIESNKILDYAIGNSKEEYFIDIFIENGVIKGDVINE